MVKKAQPTAFHQMMAKLAEDGRLHRVYTQNIDGLETSFPCLATEVPLGSKEPWPRTIQLHGSLDHMVCRYCCDLQPLDTTIFQDEKLLNCKRCEALERERVQAGKRKHKVGTMRPRMVLYDELHPEAVQIGSVISKDIESGPDLVLVVGTTLKVVGVQRLARDMCVAARENPSGLTAWINTSTPQGSMMRIWDLVIQCDCNDVAKRFLASNLV